MKQRYNVEVVDIPMGIISDDGEEFVKKIAETVDTRVRELTATTKYLSNVEALILLAMDYCGEKAKADRKIKSLETQVEILEANLRRLRVESASAAAEAETSSEKSPSAETAAPATEPAPAPAAPEEKAVPETAAAPAAPTDAAEDSARRSSKLRAIEALLGSQLRMDMDDDQ